MMKLLATAALAAALASPALAQTTRMQSQARNAYAATDGAPFVAPYAAPNASAFASANAQRRSINPSTDVYDTSGRYVGSDPDPSVRDQLARDPTGGD